MKIKKGLVVSSLSLCMLVSLMINVVKAETTFYEEKGQINLENVYLDYNEDESQINIIPKNRSAVNSANELSTALENSDELKKEITSMYERGDKPIAIGYTRVYLKEVKLDEETSESVPMTVDEVEEWKSSQNTRAIGNKENGQYGNFTLYTAASYSGTTINATSVATFNWESSSDTCSPAPNCFDIISLAFPYGSYVLTYSEMPSTVHTYNKALEAENAVAYGVLLYKGWPSTSYHDIKCSGKGTQIKSSSSNRIVSNYVHNWGIAYPTGLKFKSDHVTLDYDQNSHIWRTTSSVII